MYPLDGVSYSATLRGKAGEFLACRRLDTPNMDRLLPTFILPPLFAPGNNEQSVESAIATQIGKIFASWGSRPCLLDLSFLTFGANEGTDIGHLVHLLERARSEKCCVMPIIDLTSDFYRVAAIGAHNSMANSGTALRVMLGDLNNHELKQLIDTQVANLKSKPNDCVLVLDCSAADISDTDEFSKFANDWLHRLRELGMWSRIVFQATGYPWKNPAPDNGEKTVVRDEWSVWTRMLELDPHIKDFVMFGDFGADNADIDFGAVGRAITHLRYATSTDWLVVRGDKKRESIRSVAARIVNSGSFSGELFSWGDEFIASRARGVGGVGNPMIWRAVNMNHHMTRLTVDLGRLYGIPISPSIQRRQPIQEELLASLPQMPHLTR
jgi:hypothetical protein